MIETGVHGGLGPEQGLTRAARVTGGDERPQSSGQVAQSPETLAIFETPHSAASYRPMQQPDFAPRRRRWPSVLIVLIVLGAGLWAGAWYYAAGKVEETIAGWKEREARSGRVYSCASQTISGFPFSIEVRCANAGAELTSTKPPIDP